MSAARSRIVRAALGAACIAAATAALVWFAFQFTPGEPRARKADQGPRPASISAIGASSYEAERIVDVPFGQTFRTESLTRGKWFSVSEEERASWSDEERERYLSEFDYLYDSDGIEIVPASMKAVTLDAFAEWYPHYALTTGYTEARKHECKVLLVDATMTNTMECEQYLPVMQLWSEDFNGANDMLDNGGGGDSGGYLLGELYGAPSERGLVQNTLPGDWNVLQPGETRAVTLPYLVYANTFCDRSAYDDIDPSRFCLALSDYDPPTIYRLWLG